MMGNCLQKNTQQTSNNEQQSPQDIEHKQDIEQPIIEPSKITEEKFANHNLSKIAVLNIKPNHLDNYIVEELHWGYVISVYDGDTITIATKFQFLAIDDWIQIKIRLNGIDAPELRTKNEEEKEKAKQVKQYLQNLILHKYITLTEVSFESKWSRYLATIHIANDDGTTTNVNQDLLKKNFVKSYDGGHKEEWKKEELAL